MAKIPKTVIELPLVLNENTPSDILTHSDGTANQESEIIKIKVPRNATWAFSTNDWFYFLPKDSGGSQITSGVVRMYLYDANKIIKYKLFEGPVGLFAEKQDRNKKFFLPSGFVRTSDELIVVTFESATAYSKDNSEFILTGRQFIRT